MAKTDKKIVDKRQSRAPEPSVDRIEELAA